MSYWVGDDHSYGDLVRLFHDRGGSFQHGLDEYRRRELLADWLKQQIDFGFFQVAELHPPPPLPPNPGAKAAKAIKEDVAPVKEKLGWFEVTVVDAWGKPVDGVELEVVYEGTRKKVTTPGNGKVKLPDIAASFGSARITNVKAVRDTLRPRWKDKYQPTELPEDAVNPEKLGLDATELTTSLESETPKTLVLVKPLTRIRLIGMHFDTNKCFLRPSAMNGIKQVVAVYKANPTGKLLILGHTDTTADDNYNLDLSVERADAIKAYLKDDVAAWEAWFGEGKPKQKRWGDGEVAQMIKPLPCEQTVAGFQAWSNENKGTDLKVDGIAGPKTRKALIEAYMALDGTTLPEGIEAVTHGCGEFFPRTDEGDEFGKDGVAAEENRRVEMYCFDDQIFPPVPGPKASKGEPEYERWKKQVTKTVDLGNAVLVARVVDEAGTILATAQVRLDGPTSAVATSDREGTAQFSGLPNGVYTVRATRDGYESALGEISVPLSKRVDVVSPTATTAAPSGGEKAAFGDTPAVPSDATDPSEPIVAIRLAQNEVAVVIGVFAKDTMPVPLDRTSVVLVDSAGVVRKPSQANLIGPSGQIFARFEGVPFGAYTAKATRQKTVGGFIDAVGSTAVAVDKAHIKSTGQIEAAVTMIPIPVLQVTGIDPDDKTAIKLWDLGKVVIDPPVAEVLDEASHTFRVDEGTTYTATFSSKNGYYIDGKASVAAGMGLNKIEVVPKRRTRILYIVIDRPADAKLSDHDSNKGGVVDAAAAYDGKLTVEYVHIADLIGKDIEATYHPFAIFGAGSFSEWFRYGTDKVWKEQLDNYMKFIRGTTIPMLAVCGSHQLVAAAFNGFGAVAHMNDDGPPVKVSTELAASPPSLMRPKNGVGEQGTYPISVSAGASLDLVVKPVSTGSILTAVHHKDMVIDTTGFVMLFEESSAPTKTVSKEPQAKLRCHVHGMKLNSSTRLLYSVQFHPEMPHFKPESTEDDGGFGAKFIKSFLTAAKAWWPH